MLTGVQVVRKWWRVITRQQGRQDELIEGILRQLRGRLCDVLSHPQPGGKKVIINIAPDRTTAWIELPPEVLEVRTEKR